MLQRQRSSRSSLVRGVDAPVFVEHFLISAVAAVLGIRIYLAATGYPQIGGGGLHIAHMLWGGLLMLAALVAMLIFLGRQVRAWSAIVGGLGFGTFIDELGKFITSDNDYFYQPTIALIYAIFVVLALMFQALVHKRPVAPRAALVKALDVTEEAVLRGFQPEDRQRILGLIQHSDPHDPLARVLREAIVRATPAPPSNASLPVRTAAAVRRRYQWLISRTAFLTIVVAILIFDAVFSVVAVVVIIVTDPRYSERDWAISFVDAIRSGAAAASVVMVLIGAVAFRQSRLRGYIWLKRSLLVTLFLIQFFLFFEDELAAAGRLFFNLLMLAAVNYAISRERTEMSEVTSVETARTSVAATG